MNEIQRSTRELVSGVEAINTTTAEFDKQAQHNGAIAHDNSNVAASIKQQAEGLGQAIHLLESLIAADVDVVSPALVLADAPLAEASTPAPLFVRQHQPADEAVHSN